MLEMLGLPTEFGTTKGKKVQSKDVGAVFLKTKRSYRQYMNRKNGFSRNLDPEPATRKKLKT